MKFKLSIYIFVSYTFLFLNFGVLQSQNKTVAIKKIANNVSVKTHFSIPFLKNENDIKKKSAIFSIKSSQSDLKAEGWIGVNKQGIYLLVEVFDKEHINRKSDAQIWDGDALQIGIDVNGDGTRGGTKDEIYIGPNDAMYAFGLSGRKAISWAHYHGDSEKRGGETTVKATIERNEAKNTTSYSLFFPWDEFNWAYGFSDYLGLSVMVNDLDNGALLNQLKYGDGVGSKLKPGLFEVGTIERTVDTFYSTLIPKTKIWSTWDNAIISVACHSFVPSIIQISTNSLDTILEIPASKDKEINRYTISVKPKSGLNFSEQTKLKWLVNNKAMANVVCTAKDQTALIEEFRKQIGTELLSFENIYEQEHLLALSAIVENEYQNALINLGLNPTQIEDWALYTAQFIDNLKNMPAIGHEILTGQLPMIKAFKASSDNSLQIYRLQFPANYVPSKEYPLIVDLHGSGNPYVLSFIDNYQEHGIANQNNKNKHEAFVLSPWGRGNQAYLEYSGNDIYDYINDVKRTFKIDQRRTYLTGFSMGGWGTWYHGIKSADLWAAIAPCAGSIARDKDIYKNVSKLSNTPVLIWNGMNDGSVADAKFMYQELSKINANVQIRLIENRGHEFKNQDRIAIYDWLMSQQSK